MSAPQDSAPHLKSIAGDARRPLLPRMIIAHVLSIALLVVVNSLVPFELSVLIDIMVLVMMPIATAISTGYLLRLFWADPVRPRSELLAFLTYGAFVITVALTIVGIFAVVRVLHDVYHTPFFSTEATTTAIAVAFALCGTVPIMKGFLFRDLSRYRGPDRRHSPRPRV